MKIHQYREMMRYLTRKPVSQIPTPEPIVPEASNEELTYAKDVEYLNKVEQGYATGGRVGYAEGDVVKASKLSELLKEYDIEVSPKNIGRFSKQYQIEKDPTRPSASGFYLEPTEEELKKIKADYDKNILKASGSTEAGKEAFKVRETRAKELLTQGYNQTEADEILKKEFNKSMKSTLTKVSKDLKEEGVKVVSGRESEVKTPASKFAKERRELQKSVSDPSIEKLISTSKKEAGFGNIDLAHRTSMKQNDRFGTEILSSNLGLDPQDVNRRLVKPIENELEPIYKKQKSIVNKINKEGTSSELRKELESLNKQVSDIVAKTEGKLQGILIDEYNLKPKTVGIDYANVFGAGVLPDKPVSQLTKEEIALGIKQIPGQEKAINKIPESLASRVNNQLGFGPAAIADVGGEVLKDVKGLYGKYAPQVASGAMTGLRVIGTPAVSAALYADDVYSDLKKAAEDGSVTASKTIDAVIGHGEKGLYFMLPELAKDVVTNPIVSKILQLGSFGRVATPLGAALTVAGIGKDFYDQYKEFKALPLEQQEMIRKQFTYDQSPEQTTAIENMGRDGAAMGGRIGYKEGSDDETEIPTLNSEDEYFGKKIKDVQEKDISGPRIGFMDVKKRKEVVLNKDEEGGGSGGIRELKQLLSNNLQQLNPVIGYGGQNYNTYISKGINPYGDKALRYGASYSPEGSDGTFSFDKGPGYVGAGYGYEKDNLRLGIGALRDKLEGSNIRLTADYKF
jgi:hypothetical protein